VTPLKKEPATHDDEERALRRVQLLAAVLQVALVAAQLVELLVH
jgi:hypothetical protein